MHVPIILAVAGVILVVAFNILLAKHYLDINK